MDAAFCSAERVTLAASITPIATRSTYSPVAALRNSQEVIRWNTDKHYLSEIEKSGLPVVPTAFANSTTDDWLAELERLILLGDVVVKPTISAGSNDTERHLAGYVLC